MALNVGIMLGANLGFGGIAGVQGANQDRLALANGVTGNETSDQIASLAQADKAATLRSAASSIESEYGYGQENQAKRLLKKNLEQERRLFGLSVYG